MTRNFEFLKISNVSKINFKFPVVNIVKTCLWGILPGAAAAFLAACSAMPEGQSGYSASGAHAPYGGLNPMELSDLATRKYLEGSSEEALGAVDALISDAGAMSIPHLREYAYTRALILNDLFDSGKCGGRSVFEAYESAFSNWEYVFAGDTRLYITRLYEYLSGFLASYDPDLAMENRFAPLRLSNRSRTANLKGFTLRVSGPYPWKALRGFILTYHLERAPRRKRAASLLRF